MSISTILLIVLVLLLIGALPTWPYSGGWGYYPSGGLGLVVLASAADSGKLLGLSAYRFRRDTRYSAVPLGGFQRVAERRRDLACQGGDVAGMRASAAARRSSQIT